MPQDPNSLFQKALAALGKNRFEEARAALEEALNMVPGNPDILSFLGFAEASLGMPGAHQKTEKGLAGKPDNPQMLLNHAFALETAGRDEEAISQLEKANTLAPGQGAILNHLSRLYEKTGAFEKVYPLIGELKRLFPKEPLIIERVLKTLVALEKGKEAYAFAKSFEGKLEEGEFLWNLVARGARAAKEWQEAYRYYRKLNQANPNNITYKRGLSHALIGLENFAEVIPLLKEIRKLDPENEAVIYSMAYALFNDHRHEECLPFVEKILEKNPDHIETLIIKGRSLIYFGELEEAEKIFKKVLKLSPEHPMAVMQLAKIKKPENRDETFDKLEKMEKTTTDENDYRALMGYTLGEMYEGTGDYDQAFHYFRKGNRRARKKYAERGFKFDSRATSKEFETIRALYSPETLKTLKDKGADSTAPVFIVAMPRSGTTLLEQIVSSHSEVFGAGELPLGQAVSDKLMEDLGKPEPAVLRKTLEKDAVRYARLYLDYLPETAAKERFVSDKMPNNFLRLGLLQSLLPKARFIHIRRNPLDVCLSIYKGFFGKAFTYALDLKDLGFYYRQYHELMDYWRKNLVQPLYELEYEQLTKDPEGQSKQVFDYIGLDWEPECLEFHKRKNRVITMSAIQVREPVHKKSVDKWRRYEKHLGPLLEGLGEDIVKTLDI